ncbi:class I SAM-dependent methyltransferase [Aspergillus tanneri]|uniref:Methyltransferase type 12 domain-containing protein n=1 Tax=Aspergillus tanneri TaxID=1220188 RepID=A0A5M9N4D5_9EURO|nr:uncharacterized protein ATNIH1004_002098 [Aspergillus tanneri]KAA8649427.1 hypothetical protein ATNIH1004_002098 [Aspergillus tanneri]
MSILEIGAGTGSATKKVISTIGRRFASYTFTDISSGFFDNARELFSSYEDYMLFKVLDAEKDIVSQGFSEHSYHLIIASFVLHATSKLEHTLSNIRRLVKPGVYLVMLEAINLEQSRLGYILDLSLDGGLVLTMADYSLLALPTRNGIGCCSRPAFLALILLHQMWMHFHSLHLLSYPKRWTKLFSSFAIPWGRPVLTSSIP